MFPKIMSSSKGNKFPPATEGTHVAIVTTIVDCGTQEGRFGNKPELFLSFEITDEFNEWTDASGPRREPKRVSTTVTNSMSEKAKLRGYIEGIQGSRLSDAQLRDCDVVGLLVDKPCLLHVVHNDANGNTYANIANIAPLPKSMRAPQRQGELLVYTPLAHDSATWDQLPKFLQEKIGKRVVDESPPARVLTDAEPFSDDLPF